MMYWTKTLLYTEGRDINIRYIYNADGTLFGVLNPAMGEWTEKHEKALAAFIKEMDKE